MTTKISLKADLEIRLVLEIANEIVYGVSSQEIGKCISIHKPDWYKVRRILEYYEIAPSAYPVLKHYSSLLPSQAAQWLNNKYSDCRHYLLCYWDEFLKIVDALQKENIDILPIKGLALLFDVYKPDQAREMRDLDIICKKQDVNRAESILYNLGYQKELMGYSDSYWRNKSCHLIFSKQSIDPGLIFTVELHWSLGVTGYDRDVPRNLWDNIRDLNINGRVLKVLSAEDTFLGLCIHYRRFGRRFSLKNLCDIALLLEKYNYNFNWDYVISEIQKGQLNSLVFFILKQIELTMGTAKINGIINKLVLSKTRKLIINRFIKRNVFLFPKDLIGTFDFFKLLCLKSQILLYDTFKEPLKYAIDMPIEVFAQIDNLSPYSKKTKIIYKFRMFVYLLAALKLLIKKQDRLTA